jgi:hypothetical protein
MQSSADGRLVSSKQSSQVRTETLAHLAEGEDARHGSLAARG